VAREERTEERRRQILRAALEVFSRKGYHGATIREIASVAGLAEGTIYLYFQSKHEVLKGVFALLAHEAVPPVVPSPAGDDAAYLAALIHGRVQALARYAPFIRLMVHEADLQEDLPEFFARLHGPFVAEFERYVKSRIDQGAFRPVDPRLAASICFRLMMSYLMTQHVLPAPRFSDEEYVPAMVSVILLGLLAREAPARPVPPGEGQAPGPISSSYT
jgi:AcrR family transcriptional regulator